MDTSTTEDSVDLDSFLNAYLVAQKAILGNHRPPPKEIPYPRNYKNKINGRIISVILAHYEGLENKYTYFCTYDRMDFYIYEDDILRDFEALEMEALFEESGIKETFSRLLKVEER